MIIIPKIFTQRKQADACVRTSYDRCLAAAFACPEATVVTVGQLHVT